MGVVCNPSAECTDLFRYLVCEPDIHSGVATQTLILITWYSRIDHMILILITWYSRIDHMVLILIT